MKGRGQGTGRLEDEDDERRGAGLTGSSGGGLAAGDPAVARTAGSGGGLAGMLCAEN